MIEAVIRELRRLQGFGFITSPTCARAERYVENHPEIFSSVAGMTPTDGAAFAVEVTALRS